MIFATLDRSIPNAPNKLALLRREQRLYRSRIKKLLNTQLLCALKRSAKRLAVC
jgi:hypothetical protein